MVSRHATVVSERPAGSDYARLLSQVKQAGLLDRRRVYYWIRMAVTGAVFVAAWLVFALLGESWWQLLVAVVLAAVFTQIGFLGHDAGHRQMFRTRRANDIVGLIHGNLIIGLSYGWWVDKHNRHHSHPNQEGHDPDLVVDPVSFTASQARRRRGVARLAARYQAYWFFPIMLLEALSLHANSVKAMFTRRTKRRPLEIALLVVHAAAYLTAVFVVLTPLQAVVFMVVHQGLFGFYLGCSFAPNHKGMPVLSEDDQTDYLRRQVLTARNVRGGWFIDTLLGGLNYQIEHHLFPNMPRPNLRRARTLVREFCAEHGLSYAETSIMSSYWQALRYLHAVGAEAA